MGAPPETGGQLPYKTIMGKQQKRCRFFVTFFTSTFLHQQIDLQEPYVTVFWMNEKKNVSNVLENMVENLR